MNIDTESEKMYVNCSDKMCFSIASCLASVCPRKKYKNKEIKCTLDRIEIIILHTYNHSFAIGNSKLYNFVYFCIKRYNTPVIEI